MLDKGCDFYMLADNLKELRKSHNLSQQKLANLFNVTQQAVAKWESHKSSPDYETLTKLAQFYEVSLDYLLKSHEDSNDCESDKTLYFKDSKKKFVNIEPAISKLKSLSPESQMKVIDYIELLETKENLGK